MMDCARSVTRGTSHAISRMTKSTPPSAWLGGAMYRLSSCGACFVVGYPQRFTPAA